MTDTTNEDFAPTLYGRDMPGVQEHDNGLSFAEEFVAAAPAAFRTVNTVGSLLQRIEEPGGRGAREEYDPFADIAGYEPWAGAFADAGSAGEVAAIKNRIDRELRDENLLAEMGWGGFAATLAAGAVDPLFLVPVGGAAATGAKTASVLHRGLLTARAGMASLTAAEVALQATQDTRTLGESALNVAAGTLLAGVLGTGVAALSRGERAAAIKAIEQDLGSPLAPWMPEGGGGGSAGVVAGALGDAAAQSAAFERELVSALGAEKAAAAMSLSPNVWIHAKADTQEGRALWQQLFENPLMTTREAAGVASEIPAENAVRDWWRLFVKAQQVATREFNEFRIGEASKSRAKVAGTRLRDRVVGVPEGKLSRTEWKAELTRAMHRGDRSDVPSVANAAKQWRTIFEAAEEQLTKLGVVLPEKPINAESYFPINYNRPRLVKEREPFKQLVRLEMEKATLREQAKLAAGEEADEALAKMGWREWDNVAQGAFDHIMGLPDGLLSIGHAGASDHLMRRALTVPVDDLMRLGVLEMDAEQTLRSYIRTVAPEIEIRRRFGDVQFKEITAKVKDEYARKIEAATSEKERARLVDNEKAFFERTQWALQSLLGTYKSTNMPLDGVLIRSLRGMRRAAMIAMNGQFAIASFPDAVNTAAVTGLRNTFKSVIKPLVTDMKGLKLAKDEAQSWGAAVDFWLDTRPRGVEDIADAYGQHSRFERALEGATEMSHVMSGMAAVNQGLEVAAAAAAQGYVWRAAEKLAAGARPKQKMLSRIAHWGLDENDLRAIAKEKWLHRDDLHISQQDQWKSAALAERYRGAMRKSVFEMVPRPAIGDVPRFASDEWGKLFFMFKRFAFGATNRILLSRLQQRDANAMIGSMLALGAGMLVFGIKQKLAGKELPDDPDQWIRNGIDRSGLTGVLMDANNISEKITSGRIGLSAITGGPIVQRYADRGLTGTLIGPVGGQIDDLAKAVGNTVAGKYTATDTHRFRRMLPYQNHWLFMRGLDEIEKGVNRTLGVPERARR